MLVSRWCIENPTKVLVGVILVVLFGFLAFFRVPVQLTPDVSQPTITVETFWPGASPQEVEKEIVDKQEEQLKSVEGMTDFKSESMDGVGRITMEFAVGTDMSQVLVKVANKLQQVREYPLDADKPSISAVNTGDAPIAWFVLLPVTPTHEEVRAFAARHPRLIPVLEPWLARPEINFPVIYRLADEYPELKEFLEPRTDPSRMRNFAEDILEARLERVSGVANCNIFGGEEEELQVVVDPDRMAARKITIPELRNALAMENRDISAGDVWESNHRTVIRTLGQFRSPKQVAEVVIALRDGQPVYVRDVADVKLGTRKPDSIVRQQGIDSLALNVQKEDKANVIEVMKGVQDEVAVLNGTVLAERGLRLQQVYDQTTYIHSAQELVTSNIYSGGLLATAVLLTFLRNIRSTLVVVLSIPISVVGTFLIVLGLGRSINVISLAGLAFAVGMVVDNAIVVLENIYTRHQQGEKAREAADKGTAEVWGAVLASTLTTLAVFIPIVFVQEQAGQLFRDIAIAISAAVGFSLVVSLTVIPVAASRLLSDQRDPAKAGRLSRAAHRFLQTDWFWLGKLGTAFIRLTEWINVRLQHGRIHAVAVLGMILFFWIGAICCLPLPLLMQVPAQPALLATPVPATLLVLMVLFVPLAFYARRLAFVVALMIGSCGVAYKLMPGAEYLPDGNRNLVFGILLPPPGYNLDKMIAIGKQVESRLRRYWEAVPGSPEAAALDGPLFERFFFVARGRMVFMGASAVDELKAAEMIPVMQRATADVPGMIPIISQASLFDNSLEGGRKIDIEITGPELDKLIGLGIEVFGQVSQKYPLMTTGTFVQPVPSLDLGSPELHIRRDLERARELGVNTADLGYAINALVDGAFAGDYWHEGRKIDLVIKGDDRYSNQTRSVEQLRIATPSGDLVPISAIARVEKSNGPEQINRIDRERSLTIRVKPGPGINLEDAMNWIRTDILDKLRDGNRLEGGRYRVELAGTADELKQMQVALGGSLLLAVLITYLLMSGLYESFVYPWVIMISVPLAATGGFLGLWLLNFFTRAQLDTLTMLGFIILIGTVVNNPILIVDQALQNIRLHGMEHRRAVLDSATSRIRPIFMTTTTTLLGMLPLVVFPGAGSELYRGLGAVILGGLLVSTLVSLVVVPMLFTLVYELLEFIGGKPPEGEYRPTGDRTALPEPVSPSSGNGSRAIPGPHLVGARESADA